MTTTTALLDEARGLLDETVDLRRRIHRHPEIGLTLPQPVKRALGHADTPSCSIRPSRQPAPST